MKKLYGWLKWNGVETRVEIINEAKDSVSFIPPDAKNGIRYIVGKKFVRMEKNNGIPKPEPSTPDKRRDPPLPRPGGDVA